MGHKKEQTSFSARFSDGFFVKDPIALLVTLTPHGSHDQLPDLVAARCAASIFISFTGATEWRVNFKPASDTAFVSSSNE